MFYTLDNETLERMHDGFAKEHAKLMTDIRSIEDEKASKKMQQQITIVNSICTQLLRLKNLRKQ